ncbi:MAG: hypothetical protein HQM10_23070 [Candidatus Riflebacteria bacterium]|nr:hypothetical protein [Candidatus Riflebacteria bacterium]
MLSKVKKLFSLFVVLMFVASVPLLAGSGSQSGQGNDSGQSMNQGDQGQAYTDQSEVSFKGSLKPSQKVIDAMSQYKSWIEKKAQTVSKFRKVQKVDFEFGDKGKGDQGQGDEGQGDEGQGGAGQCDPEQEIVRLVNAKLEVVFLCLDNLKCSGMGNHAYWKRTVQMLSLQTMLSVDVLKGIIQEHGDGLNPLIKAAITQVVNNLETVTNFSNSKEERWHAAAKDVAKIGWASAKDISEIKKGVLHGQKLWVRLFPKTTMCKASIPGVVRSELEALKVYLDGQNVSKEDGGWTFWCRTNTYLCRVAGLGEKVCDQLTDDYGWKMDKRLRQNLNILERRLDNISDKYNFKLGGQQYWKNAVEDTSSGLQNGSANVDEVIAVCN